jgi:NADPH-dependent glutamate synthase beta subunit-like oxidoreductase
MKGKRAATKGPVSFTVERAPGDDWLLAEAVGAPCRVSCPAGVDAKAYVGLIATGRFAEALEAVKRKNPLPGICGRVCTHPCEDDCSRGDIDEPVAICALKRFVADWEMANVPRTPEADRPSPPRRVAVVGAGPAGLTVANNLAREGIGVTIFEKLDRAGGTLVTGIPAYRLPREIIKREVDAIEDLGVEFCFNVEVGSPGHTLSDLLGRGYKALFLGTGAWQEMRLAVPGEDLDGVLGCLDFLAGVNLGSGKKLRGKVLVVGGGNSAIDAARTALRMGAKEVTLVYRRTRDEMPANAEEIEEALEEGMSITFLAAPVRVIEKKGRVSAVEFLGMELGPPDESGRRRPVPVKGSEFTLDADALVVAIGQRPNLSFLDQGAPKEIKTTKWNSIEAKAATGATAHPAVFAGGDVLTGPSTVIDAIEAGHRASLAILEMLTENHETGLVFGPDREYEIRPRVKTVPEEGRRRHGRVPAKKRVKSFVEVARVLTEEEAVAEARRCLRCGSCAECIECIPECFKRLAVVEDEAVLPLGSIVRVETAGGQNPFEGSRPVFRAEDGTETVVELQWLVARVNAALCRACGECVRACPYEAVTVSQGAEVNVLLCKGCGLCAGACPTGAISAPGFSDREFLVRLNGSPRAAAPGGRKG